MPESKTDIKNLKNSLQKIFDELHSRQKDKSLKIARMHNPHFTSEDLLNPDNFSEIIKNPDFMYEDGQAAGILSAQMAVMSYLNRISDNL